MTTANPQPVSSHPDSSDDLIAELARLMAQDTPAAAPASTGAAQPEPRPAAAPSVRIPGSSTEPGQPSSGNAFDFDFGFGAPPAREPAPAPAASRPQAPLVSPPTIARTQAQLPPPAAPKVEEPVAAPSVDADDDPIGALIAAELDSTFARPVPPPVAQAPTAMTSNIPVPVSRAPSPTIALPPSRPQAHEPERDEPPVLPVRSATPPPRAPESDRFVTAPVFGIASRPASPRPAPTDDPMSEIEGLIGQAVRVDLAAPAQRSAPRVDTPRVETPSHAVAHQPQPSVSAPQPQRPRASSSIDDTILAAAAATGADVDMVEEPRFMAAERAGRSRLSVPKLGMPKLAMPKIALPRRERRDATDVKPARRNGFVRPLVGLGVAAALFLAAGFGLWSVLGLGQPSGEAPVLTADATPVKEPAPPSADAASTERSLVLDGVAAGDATVAPVDEQLVSRDQADGTEVADALPVDPTDESEAALASRKVRTITVRPDGSIVNGDAALAGAEILPVERPNVPDLPAPDQVARDMLAAVQPSVETPVQPLALADTRQAALNQPVATPSPGTPPVTVALTESGAEVPYPMPRLASRPSVAVAATPVAPAAPALAPVNAVVADDEPVGAVDLMGAAPAASPPPRAAAPAPAVTTSNIASAYVQLSSQRSEEAARSSASSIRSRFGSLFEGKSLEIQRVDLGEKGVYYRVRLPAGSLNEAANICSSVKANGGDCFALNG